MEILERSAAPLRRLYARRVKSVVCLLLLGGSMAPAHAFELAIDEYQLKAALLYNLTKFVEWPREAFAVTDRITICILGNKSIASLVEAAVLGKQAGSRKFAVQLLATDPVAGACHVLFVSSTEHKRQRSILRNNHDLYVLTVGESPDFVDDGGVVNFALEDERIKLEISLPAAALLKCRISSKLLSLATDAK